MLAARRCVDLVASRRAPSSSFLSESRGEEAVGFAIANEQALSVYKAAVRARTMIRSRAYERQLRQVARSERTHGIAFIGIRGW